MEEISKANEAFQVKICMLEDELQCSKQELGRFREESAEKQLKEQKGESKEDRETKSTGISEEEVEKRVDETAKRLTLVFEERLLSEGEMYRTSIEEKVCKINVYGFSCLIDLYKRESYVCRIPYNVFFGKRFEASKRQLSTYFVNSAKRIFPDFVFRLLFKVHI